MSLVYDTREHLCDRQHLSQTGEVVALLFGLRTWHIVAPYVYRRSAPVIRLEPHPRYGYLLRTHDCRIPVAVGAQIEVPPTRPTEPGF